MNPVDAIIATAIASMVYAIWVRRHTVGSHIEWPLTLSVLLCVAGIALVSPHAVPVVGTPLHALTGVWHLDTYAGDLCLLSSQISALYALLGSLFADEDRKTWMRYWIEPVAIVAMPQLAVCMILTKALRDGTPNILDATPDGWLTGYWLVVCVAMTYIWLAGLRALWVLRRDRQSRPIANAYIAAASCGVAACVLQMIWVFTGWQPLGHGIITWLLLCSASVGTCLTAAWSWRRKEQRLRGKRPALRS
ncbi:MAG TPA: hypothetical protein VFR17_04945 [Mycobacterium sp.]|nr:hypothetical protein [Mycobacterium sp.]